MISRVPKVASVLVLVGAVAAACGDDDSSSSGGPAPDGGPSSSSGGGSSGTPGPQGVAPKIGTNAALPDLVIGTAAAALKITASGDALIKYAITGGAVPPGMTFADDGQYTGTPTTVGSYTFTVTATNQFGSDARAFTQKVVSPPADALVLLGTDQIASFNTAFPQAASAPVTITGIVAGDTLVGIDRRPMNAQLYAVGFNATAKTIRLYAVHLGPNVAVPLGTPQTFDTDIAGSSFGVDFNPAADRVRVVTNAGQNFRMNPNTGAVVDGDGVTAGIQRDGAINGAATTASETAYTNNQLDNSGITTQYTISGSSLHIQNPPNNGTLTNALAMANVGSVFGFDIAFGVNAATSNAAVTSGNGYAVVTPTGQTAQVGGTVNLVTGAFTQAGQFPTGGIKGLTLTGPVPRTIVALSADGANLIRFYDATPGTTTTQAISGVTAGEQLVGIDFRPATGQLYALGVNATTNLGTVYLLDPQTGAATALAVGGVAFVGIDLPDPATAGYGFDFNSSVDRIRVVTSTGLNFRIHPDTGASVDGDPNTAGTQPDGALTFGVLSGVAYTNGHPATLPGVTTEYGIDAATNSLHQVANPNTGSLGPAVPIKLGAANLDFTTVAGFDIPQSVAVTANNAAVTSGSAYAALVVAGTTGLYKIDLVSGAATLVGTIGTGTTGLHGIAVGQ